MLDSTLLEGQTIAAGIWSGQNNVYAKSGITVSVVVRYFIYNSGTYTAIGSAPESSSITPNASYQSVAIAGVSLPATAFNTGDKLYVDAWAHVTANTQTAATNLYFQTSDSTTAGNKSDVIVTPGYSPTNGSSSTPTPTATATVTATPTNTPTPTPTDPVVMTAGDIACDPTSSGFNNGAGTSWDCQERYTAAELSGVNAVFALGDQQYECATLAQFQQVYDPTWGQQKAITYPAAGNHEYNNSCPGTTQNGAGYCTYFGSAASPQDTNCTASCKGYYSFNLGTWHIIVLNSECGQGVGVGLCTAGGPEETWLKGDLAANTNVCTLAFWHRPYFTSGPSGGDALMHDMWVDLYNANADVVLNGHDHDYERFAPQDPNGNADPTRGITEFVVGTGGRYLMNFVGTAPNNVARNNTTFGVVKLTLHPTSYDWQFVPDGKTGSFTDSGNGACH